MNRSNPVVIVGMGGCFPEAATPDQYWQLVRSGASVAKPMPASRSRVPISAVHAPGEPKPDQVTGIHGCFVDHEALALDYTRLAIEPELVEQLDPLFKLALYAADQAWHDAVVPAARKRRTGVILGNIVLPTEHASALSRHWLGGAFEAAVRGQAPSATPSPYHAWDCRPAALPARVIAKALGLGGQTYTLDAACASSLFALKFAVEELRAGRLDVVLSGGLSRPDCLYTQMGFSQLRALSQTGLAAPFDARANGLVVGEGAGLFVLKRLADALADGDRIYAVIEGLGLSNDTDGSLLAPSSEGQLRAMRAAYREAGWSVSAPDLIECHATGTPLGDHVEFQSLRQLWSEVAAPAQCVIGSVKGTIGHLLTAAGAASLMKVLLAMEAGQLPPTSNFQTPAAKLELAASPFRVLAEPAPWPRRDGTRRAAVSAFGFGGTNAHLLLSQYVPEAWPQPQASASEPECEIAVVGMGASFGPWRGLRALTEYLIGGAPAPEPSPAHAWGLEAPAGHFLTELELPIGTFRIPPVELAEMLPQQTLLMLVGRDALADAGFDQKQADDCGLFAGIGLDLNTANYQLRWDLPERAERWNRELDLQLDQAGLEAWTRELREQAAPALNANRVLGGLGGLVAHRLAREYRFGGPCLSLSSDENSGLAALSAAVDCLASGQLNLALVSAIDLCGDVRHILTRTPVEGLVDGEGAVALVLKRRADAERDGDRIYGIVRSQAHGGDRPELLAETLSASALTADRLGYLDVPAQRDLAVAQDLPNTCLGDVASDLGLTGAAQGLAAVLKALLALHYRVLPAHRQAALDAADRQAPNLPRQPRHWLRDRQLGPRLAAVQSRAGDHGAVVILEGHEPSEPQHSPLPPLHSSLFVLRATSQAGLVEQLDRLGQLRAQQPQLALAQLGKRWWQTSQSESASHWLALVPESPDQLDALLQTATAAFQSEAPAKHAEFARQLKRRHLFWREQPLGPHAPVAFVYPGSGNHFHGMGRSLALRWPTSFLAQDRRTLYLADELRPDLFWGNQAPAQVGNAFRALLSAQVALGIALHDTLLRFGVVPAAAIGYSLGESAALFANGAWRDHDAMHLRTRDSDLFQTQLANECEAVRAFWNLPAEERVDWTVGVVMCGADQVRARLADHPRAYLLIANTPRESVIGGQRRAVEALVAALDARFFPLEGIVAVHCEVLTPVAERYHDHHLFETYPPAGVRFYSGARGASYELNRENAAASILEQASHGIDFPKTIRQAYADGFRCFVEIGPGASCTRMIRESLGRERYCAVALTRGDSEAETYFLRALASLAAEGLALELAPLFDDVLEAPPKPARTMPVPLAGTPFKPSRPARRPVAPPPAPTPRPDTAVAMPAPARAPYPTPEERVPHAPSTPLAPSGAAHSLQGLLEAQTALVEAQNSAHQAYLSYAQSAHETLAAAIAQQTQLLDALLHGAPVAAPTSANPRPEPVPPVDAAPAATAAPVTEPQPSSGRQPIAFDRQACLEFARGQIGKMLGPSFAEVDSYPTRVRLPDEPLMLVDRIVDVGGEPMSHGFVITEHDVLANGWYLDGGRIATCVAIEAGQGDLFLGAWLGIDFQTKGRSMYRLLDAKVTFHGELPKPGQVIRYDIYIDRFFRQGETHFFRFRFDGTVDGQKLLTMREGVAGFFSPYELETGKGIVRRAKDRHSARKRDWLELVPVGIERYDRQQLDALRRGDLAAAFGPAFAGLPLRRPFGLPTGLMELVDRVTLLDPDGGEYGLGLITAEMDIQPDDWFLTCHFVGDEVMPGTLMYECCLHTLRILLMRHGWVGEADQVVCQPMLEVASKLLCRGQVLASTKTVTYEVHVRELGFGPEPYCIADAYMYADAKCIVDISDMCVRLTGLDRERLARTWQGRALNPPAPQTAGPVMDYAAIHALADGNPSDFGDRYAPFDRDRIIARFPRPPFLFMSRVEQATVKRWTLESGGNADVVYDVPVDAWYFAADRQPLMPYAVLLEIALQACGWTAAYMGCALLSPERMLFRNLGGNATQHLPVTPEVGSLTTHVQVTSVSKTKEVILLFFEFTVHSSEGVVYQGDTYFGFFSEQAMANQVGVSDHAWYGPTEAELLRGEIFPYPDAAPYPTARMRMIDHIDLYLETGGAYGLGYLEGSLKVDPALWFFEAHFRQDPVWPGSLGLEAFQQLLKVFAGRYFQADEDSVFQSVNLATRHTWIYRGQVLPTNKRVQVQANIREIDEETQTVLADGYLMVDGLVIYQIQNFGVSIG